MTIELSTRPTPADWAAHTATSAPAEFAALLADVPPYPLDIGIVDRNLIAHYRAQQVDLPEETRDDINLRWLSDQLATDQRRHPLPLHVERRVEQRLQGCCRDYTLFALGVLRQHGLPARSRVGFAGYFDPEWRFDHVVPEYWDGRAGGDSTLRSIPPRDCCLIPQTSTSARVLRSRRQPRCSR